MKYLLRESLEVGGRPAGISGVLHPPPDVRARARAVLDRLARRVR